MDASTIIVDSPLTPDAAPVAQSPPGVLAQQIDRDLSLLSVLTLQCVECTRHLPAKDGGFVIYPGPTVYCRACENVER